MLEFFLADYNLPFAIALCFVLTLSMLEGLGLVIGLSLMSLIEQFTPLDIDTELDVTSGGLTGVLGWLCLHRLPLLIWLVVILSAFSFFGITLNYLSIINFNYIFPKVVLVFSSLVFSVYFTKVVSQPLSKILPKNETAAISKSSFKGLIAKITIGKATFESPAEAVIHDHHGQKHYVMVAPEIEKYTFESGSEVVLVEKQEKYWLAIPFTTNNL